MEEPAHPKKSKHDLVREYILQRIDGGTWSPGDRLPASATLGNYVGCSIPTVNKAINSLVAEDRLDRRLNGVVYVARTAGAKEPAGYMPKPQDFTF